MRFGGRYFSGRLFGAYTMDAIAKCGFGLDVDSQQNKDDPFVRNAKKAFDFGLFKPAFILVGELMPCFVSLQLIAVYFILDFLWTLTLLPLTRCSSGCILWDSVDPNPAALNKMQQ